MWWIIDIIAAGEFRTIGILLMALVLLGLLIRFF